MAVFFLVSGDVFRASEDPRPGPVPSTALGPTKPTRGRLAFFSARARGGFNGAKTFHHEGTKSTKKERSKMENTQS